MPFSVSWLNIGLNLQIYQLLRHAVCSCSSHLSLSTPTRFPGAVWPLSSVRRSREDTVFDVFEAHMRCGGHLPFSGFLCESV